LKRENQFLLTDILTLRYFDLIRIEDSFLEEENIQEIIVLLQMVVGAHKFLLKERRYPERSSTKPSLLPYQLL